MRIGARRQRMFPYIKTGGLADAVAALAGAAGGQGHELAVFIPGYRSVLDGPHVAGRSKVKVEDRDGDVFSRATSTRSITIGRDALPDFREEFFDRKLPYWTGASATRRQ